jgi:hypothetical protein
MLVAQVAAIARRKGLPKSRAAEWLLRYALDHPSIDMFI